MRARSRSRCSTASFKAPRRSSIEPEMSLPSPDVSDCSRRSTASSEACKRACRVVESVSYHRRYVKPHWGKHTFELRRWIPLRTSVSLALLSLGASRGPDALDDSEGASLIISASPSSFFESFSSGPVLSSSLRLETRCIRFFFMLPLASISAIEPPASPFNMGEREPGGRRCFSSKSVCLRKT